MKKLAAVALALAMALCMLGCGSQSDAAKQASDEDEKASAAPQENSAADKSDLRKEINSQGQYQESDYPKDAWNDYKTALENAYAVNADDNASQDDVDSAESSLRNSEYSLLNATSRDHPKKFDYDWYKNNSGNVRDGSWVAAACIVSITFQDDGERYLIATIANDDASLSNHDVLLQATKTASLDDYAAGSVLAIVGVTEEMKHVTTGSYSEYLPTINVVEVQEAPEG